MSPTNLMIDAEFQQLLPGVPAMTDAELERQLVRDGGPKDPLTVWQGKNILVDGYRRYGVCRRKGLSFTTREVDFEDRDAVKLWMLEYQNARRNNTPAQMHYQMGLMVELRRKKEHLGDATAAVAQQQGVSERTVFRALNYKEAVDQLAPEIKERILSGELKAPSTVVIELAGYGDSHQRAIVSQFDNGEFTSLTAALKGEGGELEDQDDDLSAEDPGEDAVSDGDVRGRDEVESAPLSEGARKARPGKKAAAAITDNLSVTPKANKPSRKPLAEQFVDAQRFLGKVSQIMDNLRGATRNHTRHAACREALKNLSDELEAWKEEAA